MFYQRTTHATHARSNDLRLKCTSVQITLFIVVLVFCNTIWITSSYAGIDLRLIDKVTSPISETGSYRALIIGNNNYKDPKNRWQPLKTAVTDARALAEILKNRYGFADVNVLENASRADILHAVGDLTKRVNNNDSVLLYYAGHGYLDKDTNKGYWVPVDASGNDDSTFVRNSTIRDELNTIASRAKHTLLISDSCFSGSLLRSTTRGALPDIHQDRYYKEVSGKKSVQIITAGGNEFVDDSYQDSGHSPFTYFLLNELNHNGKPLLTATEVSSQVEKAVANNTSQVPESGVLQGAGDELGEFIFLKLKVHVDVKGIPKDKVKVDVQVEPGLESATPADTYDNKPSQEQPAEQHMAVPMPTL